MLNLFSGRSWLLFLLLIFLMASHRGVGSNANTKSGSDGPCGKNLRETKASDKGVDDERIVRVLQYGIEEAKKRGFSRKDQLQSSNWQEFLTEHYTQTGENFLQSSILMIFQSGSAGNFFDDLGSGSVQFLNRLWTESELFIEQQVLSMGDYVPVRYRDLHRRHDLSRDILIIKGSSAKANANRFAMKWGDAFDQMVSEKITELGLLKNDVVIVPVPSSGTKTNMVNLIQALAKHYKYDFANVLKVVKARGAQKDAGKKRLERAGQMNIEVTDSSQLNGKVVLLVDDVLTSGSTIARWTMELLRSGQGIRVIASVLGQTVDPNAIAENEIRGFSPPVVPDGILPVELQQLGLRYWCDIVYEFFNNDENIYRKTLSPDDLRSLLVVGLKSIDEKELQKVATARDSEFSPPEPLNYVLARLYLKMYFPNDTAIDLEEVFKVELAGGYGEYIENIEARLVPVEIGQVMSGAPTYRNLLNEVIAVGSYPPGSNPRRVLADEFKLDDSSEIDLLARGELNGSVSEKLADGLSQRLLELKKEELDILAEVDRVLAKERSLFESQRRSLVMVSASSLPLELQQQSEFRTYRQMAQAIADQRGVDPLEIWKEIEPGKTSQATRQFFDSSLLFDDSRPVRYQPYAFDVINLWDPSYDQTKLSQKLLKS